MQPRAVENAVPDSAGRIAGLAIGDQTFPLLTHEQMLDMARFLGFGAVDLILAGGRSKLRLDEVRADVPAWGGRLEERLGARELRCADLFVLPGTDFQTLAPNHPDGDERKRSRELFLDVLELADRLAAPGITMLPGLDWPQESHEHSMERCVEELSWRAGQALEHGHRFSHRGPHRLACTGAGGGAASRDDG